MPVPAAVPPIDPAQSQAISAARQAQRRFSFAIKLARWNGVSLLLAAAISLLLGLFDSGLLLSAALLAGSGWLELKAGRRLRGHEPRALLWLAANQLLLMAAITIYAGIQLQAALTGQASLGAELSRHPELASMLAAIDDPSLREMITSMEDMYRLGQVLVYATLIGVTVAFSGGAALYYLSRRKPLREFLAGTPPWVLEHLQRDA
jgi:hypothetical protein